MSDIVRVRVARLGEATREVPLQRGAIVKDVLASASLYPVPGGHQVRLNNEPSSIEALVKDRDIVTLVPKVHAG